MTKKQETDYTKILEKLSHKDKRFLKQIAQQVITHYFADGDLTKEDLLLPDIAFYKKIKTLTDRSSFVPVVDYRESLIKEADTLYKRKNFELARIIYAMFFEHTFNGLIYHYCSKHRIDEKTQIEIIRSIDIQGKLTWLLKLLGFPALNENYRKIIKKLSEERNSFIHYKWKASRSDKDEEHTEEFRQIKKAVTYVKNYESRIVFDKNKRNLSNRLKQIQTATNSSFASARDDQ